MWQHFASLLWIGEYAPVPVIITGAFFCLIKSFPRLRNLSSFGQFNIPGYNIDFVMQQRMNEK
jgi:hypothetical protein